ncbi:HipA family kinase [Luteolibacter sp. Populi]|uniref:HipA family kinase n=1 Tax=Luteolibacter sp. Populi TaxID=3230487 RepID=UPI0034659AAD
MISPITITEVIDRSVQGMTRPFRCAAGIDEDFVKGAYAGKNSLCCEWVANRLVNFFRPDAPLGVPAFRMGEVPRELIQGSGRSDIRDLGEGLVFASLRIHDVVEPKWLRAQGWPQETKAQLLLLDLWLQNEDRSLSEDGGNPNLLVSRIPSLPEDDPQAASKDPSKREMLWAYDFNLAFDPEFCRERFFGAHVFRGEVKEWPEGFRKRMEQRLRVALDQVRTVFSELPLEWLHMDGDESLSVQLEVERVNSVLEMPFTDADNFWKLP